MKRLPIVNVLFAVVLLTAGLVAHPAMVRAQTAYDCAAATGLLQAECEALVAIYNATGGARWLHKNDWLQTTTPCTWYGVTCQDGRVTALKLPENSLSGALPPEIGDLAALENLSLFDNALTALPPEIGDLTALEYLYLFNNALTTLPPELGNLAALEYLYLGDNALTVLLPEIGNLVALKWLDLDDNALTVLPPEIGNLVALECLDLYNNALTMLPSEIGNLAALKYLYLGDNALTVLPPEIGNFAALKWLDLCDNTLTALPPEIGSLVALDYLWLSNNALTMLPPEVGNLTALTSLYLDHNALTALPPEIGHLAALECLDLFDNDLTALPPEIGHLTALYWLYLGGNDLTVLPAEIGNLTGLMSLDLSENALVALPPEIGSLTALGALSVPNNDLTALPVEIGHLTALYWLDLGDNDLTALPAEIGNLTGLAWLDLSENALVALPPEIGNLVALKELYLNSNALVTLPPDIGNLVALQVLHLGDNPLSSEMPEFLTSLELSSFVFYDTDWCVPSTGAVPAWLLTVNNVYGTGMICGQAPGSIQGRVTLPGDIPAAGIQVNLYRDDYLSSRYQLTVTYTSADGVYRFDGLGQEIDYYIQFVDPDARYASEYYDDVSSTRLATPLTVTLGMTCTGIDAELAPAAAQIVKSATPSVAVGNGRLFTYTLAISSNVDATLHIYDPLDSRLTWQGFTGTVPDTLTYTNNALTGSVAISVPWLFISFVVRVDVPETSFVSDVAQVSNTAYHYFAWETFADRHPSNTYVTVVRAIKAVYLPLVMCGD